MSRETDRMATFNHLSRIERLERERDVYRAVLEAMEFEKLDELPAKGIEFATVLGKTARARILERASQLLQTGGGNG